MAETIALSIEDRSGILDREVGSYVRRGYRVVSRTPTTAQLVRPKVFSRVWAFVWFLMLGVGLIVYLFWHASKRDKQLYLTVDEDGHVRKS